MNRLILVAFACTATPAMAHHEVVVASAMVPAAVWLGGLAAAGLAAFWARRRHK